MIVNNDITIENSTITNLLLIIHLRLFVKLTAGTSVHSLTSESKIYSILIWFYALPMRDLAICTKIMTVDDAPPMSGPIGRCKTPHKTHCMFVFSEGTIFCNSCFIAFT